LGGDHHFWREGRAVEGLINLIIQTGEGETGLRDNLHLHHHYISAKSVSVSEVQAENERLDLKTF